MGVISRWKCSDHCCSPQRMCTDRAGAEGRYWYTRTSTN